MEANRQSEETGEGYDMLLRHAASIEQTRASVQTAECSQARVVYRIVVGGAGLHSRHRSARGRGVVLRGEISSVADSHAARLLASGWALFDISHCAQRSHTFIA